MQLINVRLVSLGKPGTGDSFLETSAIFRAGIVVFLVKQTGCCVEIFALFQ